MAHPEQDFDTFFDSYLETALWSSNDESTEAGGEPMDANYGTEDIDKKSYYGLRKDALKFYKANIEDITSWEGREYGPHASAGHDFWLNRNGHGAGFWDDVEYEIEALDWRDLAEFLAADQGPFEPCAQFRDDLRRELLTFVRGRRA